MTMKLKRLWKRFTRRRRIERVWTYKLRPQDTGLLLASLSVSGLNAFGRFMSKRHDKRILWLRRLSDGDPPFKKRTRDFVRPSK